MLLVFTHWARLLLYDPIITQSVKWSQRAGGVAAHPPDPLVQIFLLGVVTKLRLSVYQFNLLDANGYTWNDCRKACQRMQNNIMQGSVYCRSRRTIWDLCHNIKLSCQTEHFLKFDFMSHIHQIKSPQKMLVKGGQNLEESNQISHCQLSHVARSPGFLLVWGVTPPCGQPWYAVVFN